MEGTVSEQGIVGSGVPQGSVLGPLLFLDSGIECTSVRFGDDAKLGGLATSLESTKVIQEDPNRIRKWPETWQMKFNPTKCNVIHGDTLWVVQNWKVLKLKNIWG